MHSYVVAPLAQVCSAVAPSLESLRMFKQSGSLVVNSIVYQMDATNPMVLVEKYLQNTSTFTRPPCGGRCWRLVTDHQLVSLLFFLRLWQTTDQMWLSSSNTPLRLFRKDKQRYIDFRDYGIPKSDWYCREGKCSSECRAFGPSCSGCYLRPGRREFGRPGALPRGAGQPPAPGGIYDRRLIFQFLFCAVFCSYSELNFTEFR